MSNERINQYGLSRDIDAATEREIRKRCGFGCVVCGNAVYTYEHVDPTFANARKHDPDCIVLLCGGCHTRVNKKLLSKETVKHHSVNPKCLEQGFSNGPFDLGSIEPEVVIGTMEFKGVSSLIRIRDDDIFSVKVPEAKNSPFLLSAKISDRNGNEIMRIEDNEWITNVGNWDVEVVGPRITIRKSLGDIALRIRSEPPGRLVIERLDMFYKGFQIIAKENVINEIITPSRILTIGGSTIVNSNVGIYIDDGVVIAGMGGGSVSMKFSMRSTNNRYSSNESLNIPDADNVNYRYYYEEYSSDVTEIIKRILKESKN